MHNQYASNGGRTIRNIQPPTEAEYAVAKQHGYGDSIPGDVLELMRAGRTLSAAKPLSTTALVSTRTLQPASKKTLTLDGYTTKIRAQAKRIASLEQQVARLQLRVMKAEL